VVALFARLTIRNRFFGGRAYTKKEFCPPVPLRCALVGIATEFGICFASRRAKLNQVSLRIPLGYEAIEPLFRIEAKIDEGI